MARIIYTGLVESIRGSIGGTTFQRNAYGYTVKRKPNMINPNSALQNARKLIFSRVTRAWRDLTQAKRDEYDSWASTYPQYSKYNPESQLSGYAVFVKYNCLRLLTGASILTATLAVPPDTDTLTYEVENDSGVLKVNITSTTGDEEWIILFFMSRRFTASQLFIGTSPKYIKDSSNATQSVTITTQYTDIFGYVPSPGDLVALDSLLIGADCPKVLARDSDIYTVAAP